MSELYAQHEYHLAVLLLGCAMFGMGTTLSLGDFRAVLRAPQGVLLVLVMQLLVTPLVAIGLARIFSVPQGIAVGMLVVAALPGGLYSNMFTYFARANVPLSIAATAVCTLACLVTTTVVLRVYGAAQIPEDFRMPVGRVVFEITFCLLLPLAVGMTLRRVRPDWSARLGTFCIRASLILLLLIVFGSMIGGRLKFSTYGWRSPFALIAFGIANYYLCFPLGFLLRLRFLDQVTIGLEVLVRNAHLGILLTAALFPAVAGEPNPTGDGVWFVILVYGGVSLVAGTIFVLSRRVEDRLLKRRSRPADEVDET